VLAIQVAGLAEGLTIAEQAGMDVGQIAELILDSPIASRAFQMKLPRMTANRFDDTDFSVQWLHKDTRYAITLAEALGVPTHMAAAALNVYGVARDKGWGEADFAAVIQGVRP
jgi:3-hydroxyisobutyrate dehydrogenase-like beta-hydroxyacid dehydrogenase